MKTYIIAGNPIPLARPRFSFKRIYDKQQNEKFIAGIELAQQHGDLPFLSGPLHLDVTFFMPSLWLLLILTQKIKSQNYGDSIISLNQIFLTCLNFMKIYALK